MIHLATRRQNLSPRSLYGTVCLDRGGLSFALLRPVGPNGAVDAETIVPKRHVADLPPKTDLVVDVVCMFEEHVENGRVFIVVHAPKSWP